MTRTTDDHTVDYRYKGFPTDRVIDTRSIDTLSLNIFTSPMSLPIMTLRSDALAANLGAMAQFCRDHGVRLAPHIKTHMSPELWRMQADAGAWALTAASVHQAEIFRRHGARRILIANQLIDHSALAWVRANAESDPELELILTVDSHRGVDLLAAALDDTAATRPTQVLVEVGYPGARAGVRAIHDVLKLVRHVTAKPTLHFAGIEGYEGAMPGHDIDAESRLVAEYLTAIRAMVTALTFEGHRDVLVTLGGSIFFGAVIAALDRDHGLIRPEQVVLRSGCYLTHDHGVYARSLRRVTGDALDSVPALEPAIEVWANVLSVPEPGMVIAGIGRRDVSSDSGLPLPLWLHTEGGRHSLDGALRSVRIFDQHLVLASDPEAERYRPGDILGFGISHPCTTFDKWRAIPVVDVDGAISAVAHTYF